jgi:hypothetical protein
MNLLPLFISFPRTGAHWINCVMECYFDRPRLRERRTTFLDRTRTDWMWFHDHDMKLDVQHADVLLLYREPVATVFSNLVYDRRRAARSLFGRLFGRNPAPADLATVARGCDIYRRHCEKWLLSGQRARTMVRHEYFRTQRAEEFGKICAHFGRPLDVRRMEEAFATVTPEALVAKTGDTTEMGSHMLGEDYEAARRAFAEQWGGFIREHAVTLALRPFFS